MKTSLLLAALMGCVALMYSCQQADDTHISPLASANEQETLAIQLGESLQMAMQNPSVRHYLKDIINQQFDGDYNVLALKALNEDSDMLGGETLLDVMWDNHPITGYHAKDEFTAAIQAKYPLMQIAMPEIEAGSPLDWDAEHFIPTVAIAPTEGFSESLNAITPQGTFTTMSSEEEPTQLTLVISGNERFKILEPNEPKPSGYIALKDIAFAPKYPIVETRGEPMWKSDPVGRQEDGPRDNDNGRDELVRFRFRTEKAFKDAREWWKGDLEIRCLVLFARANGNISTLNIIYDVRKRDVKNLQWYYFYHPIVTWDQAVYGNAMKYMWWELDNGDPVVLTTNVTSEFEDGTTVSNQITINVEDEDDNLGEAIVEYCDPIAGAGTTYTTSKIYFSVR